MAPRYKIDSTKRVVAGMMQSDQFNSGEKQAYLLGMRSMCRILAGDEAGVTRLVNSIVEREAPQT